MIGPVVRKELRGYFNSAIAVIFLAAFLAVTLYTFFWREKFFARGVADLRPLFEWLPRLMIILVSALAMRLWADERRGGTLELLLTLPVPRWQLVVGKFAAGMVLIGVALALTLGLPLTIAQLGSLDPGPVIGGYLAALLLSAAYLAIGMCVSAATSNQIVAFIGTALACGVAYALGDVGGELGRALGTGARFESIARGVLDLRDLAYYVAVIASGLALNVLLLARVTWSAGPRTRARRRGAVLAAALIAANALALVAWLAPVRRARIDLTADGTYSLSPATARVLAGLDEPLLIRGYFSAKLHPELVPLVPQIEDLLEEYRIAGRGKVRVELVDPTTDDAKREAKERFGLDPTPLRFASETERSVINAYFAIAVAYGDQQATLGLDDLIRVRALDVGKVEITLENLEYQLTRTIKKTVTAFASLDALFASMPGKVELTAYVTPATLPEAWKDAPGKLQKAVDALTKQAGGKLAYATVEPTTEAQIKELFTSYGLRPYSDLLSGQIYYFHLLMKVGDRVVRIVPPADLAEAELERALREGLERAAPGFTRVVGLWVPPAPPPMPGMEGMPPHAQRPPQTFQTLREALAASYEIRDVTLDAPIPDDVETLVLAGPANLDAKAAEHVDQFVMRGGALVALAGAHRLAPLGGLALEKVTTGLDSLFAAWGITLGTDVVMDRQSDVFPIPQNRDLGNGLVVRELVQLPYPFFVKATGGQLADAHLITGGLPAAILHWATPVTAAPAVGDDARRVEPLIRSSGESWLTSTTQVEPDLRAFPETGFPPPGKDLPAGKRGAQVLAVALTGGFKSAFVQDPAPAQAPTGAGSASAGAGAGSAAPAGAGAPATAPSTRLAHSPPDTRIVVFGSSAFVSDDVIGLAQQLGSDIAAAGIELVHNAVDWSLADTDLLAIRMRSAASHALTVAPEATTTWRNVNLALAFAGLALVVLVPWLRRRAMRPITDPALTDLPPTTPTGAAAPARAETKEP